MYKTAISQIQTLSVMSCLYHLDVTAEFSRLPFLVFCFHATIACICVRGSYINISVIV